MLSNLVSCKSLLFCSHFEYIFDFSILCNLQSQATIYVEKAKDRGNIFRFFQEVESLGVICRTLHCWHCIVQLTAFEQHTTPVFSRSMFVVYCMNNWCTRIQCIF